MANELTDTTINLKSLSQNIPDPVIVGAGDANGRTLRIIFTQAAAAQMTDETKVYLSWYHQEKEIKGYNVFSNVTDTEDDTAPPTWEIKYPKSMLHKGNVLACIQLVDSVSIATSTNFIIHVLIDPNDGSAFVNTDDFTEFQKATILLTTLSDEMQQQMSEQKLEFEEMQLEFFNIQQITVDAKNISEEAKEIADHALHVAQEAENTILGFTNLADEAKTIAQEAKDNVAETNQKIDILEDRIEQNEQISEAIQQVALNAKEIAEAIQEKECSCGISQEVLDSALQALKDDIQTEQNSALTINEF